MSCGPHLAQDSLLRAEVARDGLAKVQPELRGWRRAGLATLSDGAFRKRLGPNSEPPAWLRRYEKQIKSIRCYGEKQGVAALPAGPWTQAMTYGFWTARSSRIAWRGAEKSQWSAALRYPQAENFFFRKHCAVAGLLEQQEPEPLGLRLP